MKLDGMSRMLYFFDTYAFFEIIRGNTAYAKYQDANVVTTAFNMAELNYGLKKELSLDRGKAIRSSSIDR